MATGLQDVVHIVIDSEHAPEADHSPSSPPAANGHLPPEPGPSTVDEQQPYASRSPSLAPRPLPSRLQSSAQSFAPLVSPSARRPPPQSAPQSAFAEHPPPDALPNAVHDDPYRAKFVRNPSNFRGAWEYNNVDGWGKGRMQQKRRHSTMEVDSAWKKWEGMKQSQGFLSESDHEHEHEEVGSHGQPDKDTEAQSSSDGGRLALTRHASLPHIKSRRSSQSQATKALSTGAPRPQVKTASSRWAQLRSKLLSSENSRRSQLAAQAAARQAPSSAAGNSIDLADELLAGPLSGLMLMMFFERDAQDQRRVPVFLQHVKIRVSDSLHPLHNTHAVFRIECEYANGASRWVIYRELRDFLSLHTHYRLANAYSWNDRVELPEFPRTSLPYFNILKREGKEKGADVSRADFARLQREALENYLIGLVRATMFRAEANRLCKFFEISALSVSLAHRGGVQGKSGILRVVSGHASRKTKGHTLVNWKNNHDPKWWIVRESFLVGVDDIGSTDIYDVFLIDSDFVIERPKRYYRKGLNFLHLSRKKHTLEDQDDLDDPGHTDGDSDTEDPPGRRKSLLAKLRDRERRGSTTLKDEEREKNFRNGDAATQETSDLTVSEGTIIDPSTRKDPRLQDDGRGRKKGRTDVSQHTFYIQNSQRRLKLVARNERQMQQWIASMERMAARCVWKGQNRFDSFAPIRLNVAAQWLVDGRDYFWNVSRALLLAKETIYIHDWWLSPELYLRRPNKENYRLDQILKRKAREGVKIYVIIYQEVSSRTTPTDSNHTKQRLTALHENIMVQRSPSHFTTGNFYWAHHEKLCVIDEAIAFMGGFDLCFGRWDTSQHIMVDNGEPGGQGDNAQVWPGKDYNNGRVADFHTLNKPFEDMHDRQTVPRMPWHDVGVQFVGQPARDLCRHFVQRWNWLLRVKSHTRLMPFLLPPPDFNPAELDEQGLTGTCEVQICRSCGPWSMGTQTKIEHSIQNAYLKAIQMSEHFVYIENQFFITSTMVDDVKVENKIGDAMVNRIIRAHQEGTKWRACILIPLLPGFAFPVDHSDASSVRIIVECQMRTICRGPDSIFARLRKEGIDPDEYITFFSLRGWGKFDTGVLTTEQVYIHGKIMLVDDRVALIGSANINERSQRGDRDSELVAVIRDTDMIDGRMDGKPYKVGRFVHSLRVRLMREHLGVDVDSIYNDDLMATDPIKPEDEIERWDPEGEQQDEPEDGITRVHHHLINSRVGRAYERDVEGTVGQLAFGGEEIASHLGGRVFGQVRRKLGLQTDHINAGFEDKTAERERHMVDRDGEVRQGFASSVVPTLEERVVESHRPANSANGKPILEELSEGERAKAEDPAQSEQQVQDGKELFGAPALAEEEHTKAPGGLDTDSAERNAINTRHLLRKHLDAGLRTHLWTLPTPAPDIDPDAFDDPLAPEFFEDMWIGAAVHNTEVYRKVFKCVPDDLVTSWKQYKDYTAWQDRLSRPPKDAEPADDHPVGLVPSEDEEVIEQQPDQPTNLSHIPGEAAHVLMPGKEATKKPSSPDASPSFGPTEAGVSRDESIKGRKPSRPDEPFEQWERDAMEELLKHVRGHLVLYPTRFLEGEDMANNFLFTSDRILPMPIYD